MFWLKEYSLYVFKKKSYSWEKVNSLSKAWQKELETDFTSTVGDKQNVP